MKSHKYGRELRLLTPAHFNSVFQGNPIRVASSHLTLLAVANRLEYPRLGFAVSKKAAKLAVQRNRVKRVVRDSFRLKQHQLPAIDIVVIGKGGIGTLDKPELQQLVKQLWPRLIKRYNKQQSRPSASTKP